MALRYSATKSLSSEQITPIHNLTEPPDKLQKQLLSKETSVVSNAKAICNGATNNGAALQGFSSRKVTSSASPGEHFYWHGSEVNGGLCSEQAKFSDECANSFLYQHVMNFTRVRGNDLPSVLDLVLTRNELEVTELEYVAPIGSSDHCALSFFV